jgi:hypothetical protein
MAIVLDGTANTVTPLNGALGATTPSTVVATTVKAATTMAVGNATPSASGAGITFPATQSASTDANTLDDYEEGTWTPSLTFATGSTGMTYSIRSGTYVKVGNLVTVAGRILLTAKGSSTGYCQIEGLPFAGQVISGAGGGGGGVMYINAMSGLTNIFLPQYNTVMSVVTFTSTAYAYLTEANFTNSSSFYFYCTYQV